MSSARKNISARTLKAAADASEEPAAKRMRIVETATTHAEKSDVKRSDKDEKVPAVVPKEKTLGILPARVPRFLPNLILDKFICLQDVNAVFLFDLNTQKTLVVPLQEESKFSKVDVVQTGPENSFALDLYRDFSLNQVELYRYDSAKDTILFVKKWKNASLIPSPEKVIKIWQRDRQIIIDATTLEETDQILSPKPSAFFSPYFISSMPYPYLIHEKSLNVKHKTIELNFNCLIEKVIFAASGHYFYYKNYDQRCLIYKRKSDGFSDLSFVCEIDQSGLVGKMRYLIPQFYKNYIIYLSKDSSLPPGLYVMNLETKENILVVSTWSNQIGFFSVTPEGMIIYASQPGDPWKDPQPFTVFSSDVLIPKLTSGIDAAKAIDATVPAPSSTPLASGLASHYPGKLFAAPASAALRNFNPDAMYDNDDNSLTPK